MLLKKGFWVGPASNIDSKRASSAQDRFKKSARMILLLRADGTLQTFSTASAISGSNHYLDFVREPGSQFESFAVC